MNSQISIKMSRTLPKMEYEPVLDLNSKKHADEDESENDEPVSRPKRKKRRVVAEPESDNDESVNEDNHPQRKKRRNAAAYVDLETANASSNCWFCNCNFGKPQERGVYPALDKMLEEYEKRRDSSMSVLAEHLAYLYEELFYNPRVDAGEVDVPICTPQDVFVHLSQHDLDPYRQLKNDIHVLNNLKKNIDKRICSESGEIDVQLATLALKVSQQRLLQFNALKSFQ